MAARTSEAVGQRFSVGTPHRHVVAFLCFFGGSSGGLTSAQEHELVPNFNADVVVILYDNRANCRRKGEVALMRLTSHQEFRSWGRSIKAKVVAPEMLPWFTD